MDVNGKKHNVVVESDSNNTNRVTVWADAGLKETILEVEGVSAVATLGKSEYGVYIDKRYNVNMVVAHILTALEPKSEEQKDI